MQMHAKHRPQWTITEDITLLVLSSSILYGHKVDHEILITGWYNSGVKNYIPQFTNRNHNTLMNSLSLYGLEDSEWIKVKPSY